MSESETNLDPFEAPSQEAVPRPGGAPTELSRDIKQRLSGAKWSLVIVGILTIGVNVFLFMNATKEIDDLIQAQGDLNLNTAMLVNVVRVIYGAAIFLGVSFIVLGLLVYRFPILCPLVGLLLYVGLNAAYGIIDPTTLARGAILKIIIVVVLFKAVQSGFEVRRQRELAYDQMFGSPPPSQV